MIFDAATFQLPTVVETDLVVVGSGAGGLTAAMTAAEAGVKTLVLEGGEYLTPAMMSQREEEMFPRLFQDGGSRTTADRAVKIHQGRGVGGSTLHNLNLCKRIPEAIRARWAADRGLSHLPPERWNALYAELEQLLRVSAVEPPTAGTATTSCSRRAARSSGGRAAGSRTTAPAASARASARSAAPTTRRTTRSR